MTNEKMQWVDECVQKRDYDIQITLAPTDKRFHRIVLAFALPRVEVCAVDVLNPSSRMAASKSAFCSGFESDAAKSALASPMSAPL
jgi:hypothetical protein